MEISELFLPLLVLAIVGLMSVMGLFNRVIAKLGLRNFYRHKGHAVISIAGLLVGTSIICASMVVGDSIGYFIVQETYEELQLVDMTVTEQNNGLFNYSVYSAMASDPGVAGLTDALSPILAQTVTVRHSETMLFEPTVTVIGFEPENDAGFGNFILDGGTAVSGDGLGAGEAMINRDLAESLGAARGDTLVLTFSVGAFPMTTTLARNITVAEILADDGKALYSPAGGMSLDTYNIFMNLDAVQSMFSLPNMISQVKVSNLGDVEAGADGSKEAAEAIQAAIRDLMFHSTDVLPVYMANQTFVQISNANAAGDTFELLLNGMAPPPGSYFFSAEAGGVTFTSPLQPGDIVVASYDFSYAMGVNTIKLDSLDMAEMLNDLISTFLTIFGSFAIIAGVILIINIFTMLAEERKSELGMARAVGMKRRHLMLSFLYEGLAYGTVASAFGTLLGMGVGVALIYMVNNFMDFLGITLPIHFDWFSLVSAFSLGFVITFGTILLTSWKISKLNIIRAIRGIEEPKEAKRNLTVPLLGALILGVSAMAYQQNPESLIFKLLAPSGMLTGICMILWRWIGDRASITAASLGVFAYTWYAIRTYFGDAADDSNMDLLFVFSGVLIVLSIVLTIMYNSDPLIAAITGSLGRVRRWRPTIMTAVSYPLTKKFRTGMSVAMFALVVYMIVMLSVFSNMFVIDVEEETLKQGGGFDIIADVQTPVQDLTNAIDPLTNTTIVSATLQANVTRYTNILWTYSPLLNNTDGEPPDMGFDIGDFMSGSQVLGIDSTFYSGSSFAFTKVLDQNATDEQVWLSVDADGSGDVIVSSTYSMFLGIEPGNRIRLDNVMGVPSREFRVVGILDNSMSQIMGVFMSKDNLVSTFQANFMVPGLTKNVFMFDLAEGCGESETSGALERDFAALGMNCIVVREVAETTLETTNSMFVLFELYLDMGLVVGVAGLGIITIRSVVERTPEIGILRSLGFTRGNIRNAFLIEILFVATMGVFIGIVTGVLVSHEIFNVMVSDYGGDISFTVPWLKIVQVTAIAYAATIVCTIIPARNASKIAPAEALHYVG